MPGHSLKSTKSCDKRLDAPCSAWSPSFKLESELCRMGERAHEPAEFVDGKWFFRLAQNGAGRGSQRNRGNIRENRGRRRGSGLGESQPMYCIGGHEEKRGSSDDRFWRSVTSPQGAI